MVRRRSGLACEDLTRHKGIPVTSPTCTLIDLAPRLSTRQLAAAVNEADALDLVDPEALREALEKRPGQPLTGAYIDGFRVDFYWPDFRLVVETDGLRYHRTPAQQARDRVRDQAHLRAGRTPLRFTHAQVRFEPAYVEATLREVAGRAG